MGVTGDILCQGADTPPQSVGELLSAKHLQRIQKELSGYTPPEIQDPTVLLQSSAQACLEIVTDQDGSNNFIFLIQTEQKISDLRSQLVARLIDDHFRGVAIQDVFPVFSASLMVIVRSNVDEHLQLSVLSGSYQTIISIMHEAIISAIQTINDKTLSALFHDLRHGLANLTLLQSILNDEPGIVRYLPGIVGTLEHGLTDVYSVMRILLGQPPPPKEYYEEIGDVGDQAKQSHLEHVVGMADIGNRRVSCDNWFFLSGIRVVVPVVNYAIVELLTNARKYSQEGSTITVNCIDMPHGKVLVISNPLNDIARSHFPGSSAIFDLPVSAGYGNMGSHSWRLGLYMVARALRMVGLDIMCVTDNDDNPAIVSMCIIIPPDTDENRV